MRPFGKDERDKEPLGDVPSLAREEVDAGGEGKGRELDAEEDPLRWSLTAMSREQVTQGRIDVQVESGVSAISVKTSDSHNGTGLALNLRIVPLAGEEHVHLLHVRVPIDLGICRQSSRGMSYMERGE